MTRILAFTLGVIAAAVGLAWFADRPGTVTIEWLGYQIETSALVGATGDRRRDGPADPALGAAALSVHAPRGDSRPACASAASSRGWKPCRTVCSPSASATARSRSVMPAIAGRTLPRRAAYRAAQAQAAQLKGDKDAARHAFETMLESPETQLLGVRGLFLEASAPQRRDAARALAEEAVTRDPKLAWGVNALFDLQAREGNWEGALDTLAIARRHGHVEPEVGVRRRAVLLTAEARDAGIGAPEQGARACHRSAAACALARARGRDRGPASSHHAATAARHRGSSDEDLEALAASRPRARLCLCAAGRSAARARKAGRAIGEPRARRSGGADRGSPSRPSRRMNGRRRARRSRPISMTARRRASAR